MDIYEITKSDLCNRNFTFRDETEFLGKNYQNQPFIFDGLLFNVCIRGTAKIKINYKEYQIKANDMFIILPKHICSIYECSPEFEVRIILVSLDFVCSLPIRPDFDLFKSVDLHPCIQLDNSQLDDMLKIHSVITHYNGNSELSIQIQDTLIHSIFLLTIYSFGRIKLNPESAYSRQEAITRNFFNLLVSSCGIERRVSFYADKLCITPKYLTTVVKSVTKYSAQTWINEVVLIEARRYLRTTDLTVHQISDKLNFLTASSFIRFFRIHAGCTPFDYRRNSEK